MSEFARNQDSDDQAKDDCEPEVKIKKFSGRVSSAQRLVVILENASLETVKVGNKFQLLSSDRHMNILQKHGRDANSARPDIAHQCLMMLLDSPLNQSGMLQVFVHTQRNVLIEVNPQVRIPRTFDRFAGLMVQLLHKLSVKAQNSGRKLLKVIKNPITDHLPPNCKKIVTSHKAEKLLKPRELVPKNSPSVIVVGAMAHGSLDVDYEDEKVSISNYPLSAALVCAKLCTGFEEEWNIL